MAVERIEEYRQQNGVDILKVWCKPTKNFPEGKNFFYAPAEAVDLVSKYTWFLHMYGKNRVRVLANGKTHQDNSLLFHSTIFQFYQGYIWQEDIDHRDMVEYDNTDENLEAVTRQQNNFNKMTRGYHIDIRRKPVNFQAQFQISGKLYYPCKAIRNESDACIAQNYAEKVWLQERLGNQYYMFDFFKYRRGSEDILDLERTGQISEEEATYRHILRYADNAWYYLRYGLQDYFKHYHIPVPRYSLDDMGYLTHPITGQKLCPFAK